MNIFRAVVSSCVEGTIKLLAATGCAGQVITNAELWQHYGITSRPKKDPEALIMVKGNMAFVLATEDRRYRIAVEEGEVALYTDEGDKIHFKRGRQVELVAGSKLTVTTPSAAFTGDVSVSGKLSASGNVESAADVKDAASSMAAMRTKYNMHTHTDSNSGQTTPPAQQM